jgi:hypothetical protein
MTFTLLATTAQTEIILALRSVDQVKSVEANKVRKRCLQANVAVAALLVENESKPETERLNIATLDNLVIELTDILNNASGTQTKHKLH